MTAGHDPDAPLVADLQAFFARVDPVPPMLAKAAKAALGWRRIDAELAELLADSALDAEPVGARASGTPARSLSFAAGGLTIELELRVHDTQVTLLGQLAPPSHFEIEIHTTDGSAVASAESDDQGRFRTQLSTGGRIRLLLRPAHGGPTPQIETSWITI